MNTIHARVNPRLLTKASRLFTGTIQGRIIEILQNARRAGASAVEITNQQGVVTVRDNGQGIHDFAKLLDLGGSGWEQDIEESEDPAGVGIFCLAPREVTIKSNGKDVTITAEGWTGAPVAVEDDFEPAQGTILVFKDDPWTHSDVQLNAVFCGMQVIVDGKPCFQTPFVSSEAVHHSELGCRIEARQSQELSPWHHSWKRDRWMSTNALVNFHGQVVAFDFHPVSERYFNFLVDMTGEPTGIRLMLPARTCLIENPALEAMKAALELEAFRYIKKRGWHELPYKEFLRARELGIQLPEAKPVFRLGLLDGDSPEPIQVEMPEDFPLSRCYRLSPELEDDLSNETNGHLLAVLGEFEEPFVPVEIKPDYDGYSWAKLPTIAKVELKKGNVLHKAGLWSGTLTCVDSLTVTARTNDGKTFSSPVCLAMDPPPEKDPPCYEDLMLVTPEAEDKLAAFNLWYHLGGGSDEGDTFETQEWEFERELDEFWAGLHGPNEQLRRQLLREIWRVKGPWAALTLFADGKLEIQFQDHTVKTILPPKRPGQQLEPTD